MNEILLNFKKITITYHRKICYFYIQDFQGSKLLGSCLVNGLNAVNAKCILTIFQSQPLSLYLNCSDLENLKNFPRKYMKLSETIADFLLTKKINYPKLIFCCCIVQDDVTLKVA